MPIRVPESGLEGQLYGSQSNPLDGRFWPITASLNAVANPTSAGTRGFVPAGGESFLLHPAFARHPLAVHDAPPEFVILRIPPAHIGILTAALQHAGDGIDRRTARPEEFDYVAFLERQQLQVQCAVRVTGVGRSAAQRANEYTLPSAIALSLTPLLVSNS